MHLDDESSAQPEAAFHIGGDPHHQASAFQLFVQPLQQVGRFQVLMMRERRRVEDQRFFDVLFPPGDRACRIWLPICSATPCIAGCTDDAKSTLAFFEARPLPRGKRQRTRWHFGALLRVIVKALCLECGQEMHGVIKQVALRRGCDEGDLRPWWGSDGVPCMRQQRALLKKQREGHNRTHHSTVPALAVSP